MSDEVDLKALTRDMVEFHNDAMDLGAKLGFELTPLQSEILVKLADMDKKQIKPVARRQRPGWLTEYFQDLLARRPDLRETYEKHIGEVQRRNVLEDNVSGISGLVEFKDVCYNKHKKSGLHCNRNKDHDGNHSTVPEAAIGVAKGVEWANLVGL